MVEAMLAELRIRRNYLEDEELETIYFGGGTPSLLTEKEMSLIFEEVYKLFKVNDSAEITLEANPDDLSSEKLRDLVNSPVNRLSIGVQSFHEAELEWMNRAHNAHESLKSIKEAQAAGFDNISMDLIFGIQQSSHELWTENLRRTVELEVPHISMYALTVEEGTALGSWVSKGREKEAEDAYVMEQFDMGIDFLADAGYDQYEISNYAKPGREAVHNSNYWKSRSYLGIGPSAHSFNGASRSMNVANNAKYMKAVDAGNLELETEMIDAKTRYNEYVMTRLRTSWGVSLADVVEFGEHFQAVVQSLIHKGWVVEKEGVYRLTRVGKHFADAAAMELFVD